MSLSHFDASGQAHMVDVSGKPVSDRVAVAEGAVVMAEATLAHVMEGTSKKGDVLGIARIAGIMAATAFLSMWVSNTATTIMMLPIGLSVIGMLTSEKNTGEAERLFGYPRIALKQMMGWVAEWVAHEQRMLGKPTKFEKRDGKY